MSTIDDIMRLVQRYGGEYGASEVNGELDRMGLCRKYHEKAQATFREIRAELDGLVPTAPESEQTTYHTVGGATLNGRRWRWNDIDDTLTIGVNPDGEVIVEGTWRYPDREVLRQIAAVLMEVSK